MKNIILTITSFISFVSVIFIIGIYIAANMDTFKSEFTTYEEMKKSRVFRNGWLPKYIPKTATNIQEKHDLDSNSVFATFQYDPNEVLKVREVCLEAPPENGSIKFFCPPFIGISNVLLLHQNGNGHYKLSRSYSDEKSKNL